MLIRPILATKWVDPRQTVPGEDPERAESDEGEIEKKKIECVPPLRAIRSFRKGCLSIAPSRSVKLP